MPRGRPPKPSKVLELSGAFKKNPQRKRGRQHEPEAKGAFGPWPGESEGLTEEQAYKMIWETAPNGVLSGSDQMFVWNLAKLQYRVWNGTARACEMQMLLAGLGKIGMNPSERTRLQLGAHEKPKNRWSNSK